MGTMVNPACGACDRGEIDMGQEKAHAPVLVIQPVGVIRTPCGSAPGTPVQPVYGKELTGAVEIFEEYEAALTDIEGFERLWLIYWLDRAGPFQPSVVPYRDNAPHGLFATRAPCRPNPIGMSSVRLLGREGRILRVAELDILDGTPLIDIKPYVPTFDAYDRSVAGWFDTTSDDRRTADGRFHPPGEHA